jgi:valyl-tRNA synthetase
MTEPLSPRYDPKHTESALYAEWLERGYFHADSARVLSGERAPYVIVIPPPNVTAVLHMGHGLNNTLQDVFIRWRRMQGYEALWVPGMDHAGIATQNVVERLLAEEGTTREEVGREAFVERVWAFVNETGPRILEQLRSIGCSFDTSRTAFTLDAGPSRAVREVFVRLYEKGLVYRGSYIINWCPRCLTALSDEEAEPVETNGKLWYLRYPMADGTAAGDLPRLADGRPYVVVATTRPETMLGDTAVAVHPGDPRYASLLGGWVDLPLADRRIPIVADESVDPEFGTGALKVTPAHDPNDFEIGRRHDLANIDVMTADAHMGDAAPAAFRGLDRVEARNRVVAAFRAAGLLDRVEEHSHAVPHCYRCGTVVEPRLSLQWFVRMKPLAEPALAASRDGRIRFHPEHYTRVYEHWLENIHDWCISRQLWWGHRIPVWYCEEDGCDEMIVSREEPERCPGCGSARLRQDPDVLDTWFSSWLWPFSTLGWPEDTDDLRAFYPTATLVTGPDIIFFWVARMIMAGLEFMEDVPFHDVYLNGIVRDHLGRKMSKSLGNGIDPLEVVNLFGADALRYTVVAAAAAGTDLYLNYENLEEAFAPGRNFANKVWNAGRFALMNLERPVVPRIDDMTQGLELADRWILSRLDAAVAGASDHLEAFRPHEAAQTIYHFFWAELADWYLELVKPRLKSERPDDAPGRRAAEATLVEVLDVTLRLLQPFMPFISDALWRQLPARENDERPPSLVVASWPPPRPTSRDPAAEASMDSLMELIGAVRGIRAEYQVSPATRVELRLEHVSPALETALAAEPRALGQLAGVGGTGRTSGDSRRGAHAVLRDGTEITVPLEGVIDIERERERLLADQARIDRQLLASEARLADEQFTRKAPADVVQRERDKVAGLREQRDHLARKLAALT